MEHTEMGGAEAEASAGSETKFRTGPFFLGGAENGCMFFCFEAIVFF